MTRATLILLSLAACQAELTDESEVDLRDDLRITGELPADFDLATVDDLLPGQIQVVGSGDQLAAIERIATDRSAPAGFVLDAVDCPGCNQGNCDGSMNRTLLFDLEFQGGDNGEQVTTTLSSENFTPLADVTFTPGAVGTVSEVDITGALDVCATFSYRFDVVPSGAPTGDDGTKTLFVTEGDFPSTFGGVAFADDTCQSEADAAGLAGTFRAWLADSTSDPTVNFVTHDLPYVLADGTVLAPDWTTLDTVGPTVEADVTATGAPKAPNAGTFVLTWSGIGAEGADPSFTCEDWTTQTGDAMIGVPTWQMLSLPGAVLGRDTVTTSCPSVDLAFLCIEQ